MTKFKTIAAAAVAIAGLSAITPAFAAGQPGYREHVRDQRDNRVDARIDRLDDRLDQGRRSGRLTRVEFNRLNSELKGIEHLSRQYDRSGRGIDKREMSTLTYRLDRFEQKMRWERNDRNYGWRN